MSDRGVFFHSLLLCFIFLAPLHSLIAAHLGFSIYPALALAFLLSLMVSMPNGSSGRSMVRWLTAENALMLCYCAVLLPKMQTANDLHTFAGAVVVPYMIGALFAHAVPENERALDRSLTAYLAAKVCLLLGFTHVFMVAYPARPLFEGRAIYLQFGWGVEVFPCLLLLAASRWMPAGLRWPWMMLCCLALFAAAFVLVGMNSRSLLLLALILTCLTSALYLKSSPSLRMLGLVGFPLCVLLSLWILPNRLDHLIRMFDTVLCRLGAGDIFCVDYADKSAIMRMERIVAGFLAPEDTAFGAEPDFRSVFFKGSHFWPAQVFYYFGGLGLAIFSLLFARFFAVILRLVHSARRSDVDVAGLGLFAAAFGAHVFYAGNMFNDPVLFLLMGLVMNLDAGRSGYFLSPARSAPAPLSAADVDGSRAG
ncbi:MAG TPA: hypothetical protein VIO81_15435 [Methyloversatilis sp.]